MAHHCAGCSTTAGMAGCPEHGGHSWSSSQPVLTHCQHGLDLRINPRCYLCEPAATPTPLDVGLRAAALRVIEESILAPERDVVRVSVEAWRGLNAALAAAEEAES